MADVFSRLDRIQAGSVKRKDTAQGEKAAVSAAPSSSGGRDVFARLDRIQPVTDRHTAVTPSRKAESKKEPGTQKASQASGVSAAGKSGGFRARSGGSRGDGAKAQGTKRESYLPAVGGPSRQQVTEAEKPRAPKQGALSRVKDTVSGGVKSSGAAYANMGGVLVEGAGKLNTGAANYAQREQLQGAEDALRRYSEMLEKGQWADGRALTAADREQIGKYMRSAQRILDAHSGYTAEIERQDKAVADKAYQKADQLAESAAMDLERAKDGADGAGRVLVDAGASLTQSALDMLPSLVTGAPLGLAPFAVRAFGGAAQQARQDGADYKGQVLYGAASAAKEVFTERMFNMALPFSKAYGGGALDDAVERGIRKAVDRFAATEAGKRVLGGALTFGAGAVGEGLEEFIGDWMDWQMPRIYGGDVSSAEENLQNALYDFLVGSTSGLMGGLVTPGTYRYDAGTAEESGSPDLLRQAAEEAERNGRVSNRTAERVLADEEASGSLGVSLDPTMTKSQRRSAVKDAVSARAETREGAAGNGQKTTPGGLDGVLGQGRRMELDRLTAEQQEAVFQANEEGTVGMDAQGRVFTIDPAQHITRRSYESVGKRSVNAFQFDHPELHLYYREAAEALIADADLSLQQPMGQRYERTMQGNRTIQNAQASAHLRQAMDETGLSRDAIIDAAQRIVHDQGQENTAAAKRVELILDGMLSYGWRSMDGESVGPNQAYLTARDAISGAETDQAREPLPIWDMEEPADRGRSAEELRQDIGLVRRAAAALGQNGSRALTAAYDEATARSYAPQDVAESFFQVYNAALNGEALGAEAAQKAAALPEHVRLAAESAGRKDAQRAAEVKAFGENAGLTRDAAWRQAHLSSRTSAALDAMGKALGVEVRFAETVADGRANAQYGDGVITLALDAQDPVLTSMTHEAVHRIREASPEAYGTLAEFVQRAMTEESLDFNLGTRAELYRTTDVDALTEEMVADAFGRMMESDTLVERLAQEHRSLAQRIADVFRDIVAAVKRALGHQNVRLTEAQKAAFRDLEGRSSAMQALFTDALEQVAENGNAAREGGEMKFSIKRTSQMTLAQQLKAFYDGKMASSDAFYFGETPDTLNIAGLDALPLAFTVSDFRKSSKVKHNVPRRVWKNLHGSLETALFAFRQGDRIGILTGDIDGDGKPLLVGIERNVSMDRAPVNAIRSVYGLNNPGPWLQNQIKAGKEFVLLDKEKANAFLQTYGAYSASVGDGIRSTGESVPQNGAEVNSLDAMRKRKKPTGDGKFSRSDRDILDEYVREYGAIPQGETPARTITMPRKTGDGRKLSQTVRTILEAKATPDEMVPSIEKLAVKGTFSYDAYSDEKAISDAAGKITKVGWGQALTDWTESMRKGEVSKANTAMGWALYNNAANSGDAKTALSILENMVAHQRSAAQALQATRILKQLSPETQLYGVQRSVENLQEEINQRFGDGKGPELKIDQELAERFLRAKDQEARDAALRDIYRDIGRQMPSRFRDKWNAWRYLAMLGNPRTHVRNVVGNAGFAPVVAVKDLTATAIEEAVYRVSGGKLERSKAMVGASKGDRALLSAAWGDYAKVQETALGGGKYSDFANANKYVEEGRTIFRLKPLEAARKGNGAALDAEDVWFSKPHYAYAMAQYCKARGITAEQIRQGKGVKEARAYAVREAQKATYRDTNAFSQAFSELGRSIRPGNNKVRKGVSLAMEGILPFRKTPANILAWGVEYSPIGLMVGIKQAAFDVKSGKKTGAEAIDSISAGLTGTGLVAMGLYLASQGLVRGHGGDDDKERKMEEMMGHQAYALELPDGKSVTLDWLAPECLPFFVGVNLWEQTAGEAEDMTLSTLLNSVKMVSEPMLEMSCLQSLNDVFDAVGYASSGGLDGLPAALASAATSYLTQALPTLLGQAERTAEDRRYTTYTERNAFLTSDMQYTLGRASARIPGVDYQQIPYIDAWGRPEMSGNAGERAFDNFLNPAYTSEIETSAMEEELLRLYRSTGEGGVLPSRAAKYFTVSGERKDLTAEEYVQYATLKGQASYQLIRSLTESEAYRAMSEEEKVQAVKNAYDLATQTAKAEISDFGADSWVRKAVEAQEKYSIPRETYITLKTQVSGLESLKDREGETIDNSRSLLIMEAVYNTPGLSDKQRQAMFEYLGVGKKVRNLNKAAVREKLREMRKG